MATITNRLALLAGALLAAAAPAQNNVNALPPEVGKALIEAHVLEQVDGDPARALEVLEAAAASAAGADADRLEASQCELLERMGRIDEARDRLRGLAEESEAFGEWARARLDQLAAQDPQDREPNVPPALGQWVLKLDQDYRSSNSNVRNAYDEIAGLGVLAVPALLEYLPKFGPHGLQNALELLVQHDDPKVAAALGAMLDSSDPIRRTVAAEALWKLRGDARVELGRRALALDAAPVRLGGARALLEAGADLGAVAEALRAIANRGASVPRAQAAALLGHDALAGRADVDGWLEALGASSDPRVREAALRSWLRRRGPGESARKVALFDRLPAAGRESLIEIASSPFDDQLADVELLAAGLSLGGDLGEQIFAALPRDVLRRSAARLPALLGSEAASLVRSVLQTIRELELRELAPQVEAVLDHPNEMLRRAAFDTLSELAPERVLARADELIASRSLRAPFASFLASHGGPEQIAVMARLVREGVSGGGGVNTRGLSSEATELLRAIDGRSDRRNLEELLDLVSVPDPKASQAEWSARCDAVMSAIERWFTREHVAPALWRIAEIDQGVANGLLRLAAVHAAGAERAAAERVLRDAIAAGLGATRPDRDERAVRPVCARDRASGAIRVLAGIGDQDSIATVRGMLRGPLAEQALEALLAAEGLDRREIYATLLADPDRRELAARAFADPVTASDPDLRAAAAAALRAWDGTDCKAAVTFLGRIPDDERRELAAALVARTGRGEPVGVSIATAALQSLGDFRDAALVDTLALGLEHRAPDVREAAVLQLQRTFSTDAAPYLIEALKDDDGDVVAAAREALERLQQFFAEQAKWRSEFGLGDKPGKGKRPE